MMMILIFIVASAAVFWPVLFGGQIIVNHYASYVHYPIFSYFGQMLHSENLPLWISDYLSGFPTYLSQQGGFLSPLTILFFELFDFLTAYHWLTFVNFFLAGVFMYLLARNLSLSKPAAIVAGLAYTFSRLNLFLGGQMLVISNFYFIIPLFFLFLLKIREEARKYRCILCVILAGIILALGWLGGFTESVFYLAVSAFFFAVFIDWKKYDRQLNWRENLKKFKATQGCVIAGLISAILASPWLLATINFVKLTDREGGVAFGEIAGAYPSLLKYLYSSFVPFLNTGFEGITSFVFVGLLVYIFAFFSFFAIRRNKFLPYFIGLFIFTFLVFFKPSGVFWLLHKLPIFNFFYGSWKWAFMSNFALAMLTGFGLEYLSEAKVKINFKIFVRFLEICGSLFLIFVLIASVLSLKFINYKFFISAFFIAVSILIFSLYQRGYFDFWKFQKLAVVVLLFNFVLGWQGMFTFMPKESYLTPAPTIAFLQNISKAEPFRIMNFSKPLEYAEVLKSNKEETLKYDLAIGSPNLNILHNISSAAGNENFNTKRHHRLINYDDSSRDKALFSMMNVKYILSSFELLPPLKKAFETAVTKYNILVYIYENPDVLPRVYFAKNVIYTSETNEEKLFEELLKIDNFKEKTLIECSEPTCLTDVRRPNSNDDTVTIQEIKNGYLKLKTKTKEPRWLIYSESNLPTWETRIDGELAKIYTANYIYQAVFVPAGEHEIEFKYPGALKQMKYAIMGLLGPQ